MPWWAWARGACRGARVGPKRTGPAPIISYQPHQRPRRPSGPGDDPSPAMPCRTSPAKNPTMCRAAELQSIRSGCCATPGAFQNGTGRRHPPPSPSTHQRGGRWGVQKESRQCFEQTGTGDLSRLATRQTCSTTCCARHSATPDFSGATPDFSGGNTRFFWDRPDSDALGCTRGMHLRKLPQKA